MNLISKGDGSKKYESGNDHIYQTKWTKRLLGRKLRDFKMMTKPKKLSPKRKKASIGSIFIYVDPSMGKSKKTTMKIVGKGRAGYAD